MMSYRLTMGLGVVGIVGALVWHYILPPPDLTSLASHMTICRQPEEFRRQREELISAIRANHGVAGAAQALTMVEPLTKEAAQWDPEGQFSSETLTRFWTAFLNFQRGQEQQHLLITMALTGVGTVLLLLSVLQAGQIIRQWHDLAHQLLPPGTPPRPNPLQYFSTFFPEVLAQKERALERMIALTFESQRQRLENQRLQEQIIQLQSALSSPADPSTPPAPSATLPPVAPSISPSSPVTIPLSSSVSPPEPSLSSSVTELTPSAPISLETANFETFPIPSLSIASPASSSSAPTSSGLSSSGRDSSLPPSTLPLSALSTASSLSSPPLPSGGGRNASSIGRLLSEKPLSSVSDLLPYIPRFDEFASLDQLRQRSSGLLVEIRPSLEGLLMMAQTYGVESIHKYYTSLTTFLDRCFIAFPSDLAQDKYSIYWHSRVSDLRHDELLATIRAEIPHLQWVGDEGVISQIELEVVLHPIT
jgi:hypothetical protein